MCAKERVKTLPENGVISEKTREQTARIHKQTVEKKIFLIKIKLFSEKLVKNS